MWIQQHPVQFSAITSEKEEQKVAESCNRLIKNSIICWNYLYLTRKLEQLPTFDAKENLRQVMTTHSPMSWTHINMLGEYDFSEEKLKDSMGILSLKSAAWFREKFAEYKIGKKHAVSRKYQKSYVAFGTFVGMNPLQCDGFLTNDKGIQASLMNVLILSEVHN